MERLTFDQAVELFRLYCRSKGLAPRTVETYLYVRVGGPAGILSTEMRSA
mgnify:CR=1 FL=1